MKSEDHAAEYHLGYSDTEHERLVRQAKRIAPVTEHFLREAGIGQGMRVLDVGSGAGDVAMLVGRIVGPSGSVVGLEREPRSIARARERVAQAGMRNVEFVAGDIAGFASEPTFDGAVGRYVLQFLPDSVKGLRTIASAVKAGGIIAFQEGSFAPFVALSAHLPLWSACVNLLHTSAMHSGVNVEMGPGLHKAFQEAGLPAPKMRLVMELSDEPELTSLVSDALSSVLPHIRKAGLSVEALGDLATLHDRLHDEVVRSNTVVPWIALVGAWCRTPAGAKAANG